MLRLPGVTAHQRKWECVWDIQLSGGGPTYTLPCNAALSRKLISWDQPLFPDPVSVTLPILVTCLPFSLGAVLNTTPSPELTPFLMVWAQVCFWIDSSCKSQFLKLWVTTQALVTRNGGHEKFGNGKKFGILRFTWSVMPCHSTSAAWDNSAQMWYYCEPAVLPIRISTLMKHNGFIIRKIFI